MLKRFLTLSGTNWTHLTFIDTFLFTLYDIFALNIFDIFWYFLNFWHFRNFLTFKRTIKGKENGADFHSFQSNSIVTKCESFQLVGVWRTCARLQSGTERSFIPNVLRFIGLRTCSFGNIRLFKVNKYYLKQNSEIWLAQNWQLNLWHMVNLTLTR